MGLKELEKVSEIQLWFCQVKFVISEPSRAPSGF